MCVPLWRYMVTPAPQRCIHAWLGGGTDVDTRWPLSLNSLTDVQFIGVTVETSDSYKGRLRIGDSISCAPTTPPSCTSSTAPAGAAMRLVATSFTTAALKDVTLSL